FSSQTAKITCGYHRAPTYIPLQGQIHLVDLRVLEMGVEERDIGSGGSARSGRQNNRKWPSARRCWGKGEAVLAAGHPRIGKRAEGGGGYKPSVVDAVTAAQHRLGVAENVPGKSGAWAKVILVTGQMAGLRHQGIDKVGERFRRHLVFIAQAQRQAQPWQNLPVVLHKHGVIVGGELEAQRSESLGVVGITRRAAATVSFVEIRKIVQQAAIAVTAKLRGQVLRVIVHMAEIESIL